MTSSPVSITYRNGNDVLTAEAEYALVVVPGAGGLVVKALGHPAEMAAMGLAVLEWLRHQGLLEATLYAWLLQQTEGGAEIKVLPTGDDNG
jgi:hypothetical protein